MKLILEGVEYNSENMIIDSHIIFYRESSCDFCDNLICCRSRWYTVNEMRYSSHLIVCKKFRMKYWDLI